MEGIGILLEGRALLTRENMLGQRTIVTELEPSSMFGEALLFSNHPLWPATIEATKDAIVCFYRLKLSPKHFRTVKLAKSNCSRTSCTTYPKRLCN